MLFVENPNTDPYMNHALEEWLMDNFEEDCFMLWRNQKAILLGKNQNAYSEINMPYAEQHGIKIVRRITGGGTVFTDEGNIMFTFISKDGKNQFNNFQKFTQPVLDALRSLGVPAEFTGRNDLTIEGKKFSGNAQCRYKNKVLHHGTLMFSANTDELAKALHVKPIKLREKGVSSVRSRVTNISGHMKQEMDIEAFRSYLFYNVLENTPGACLCRLTESEWKTVAKKAKEKHSTHEWIYGKKPEYNVYKEARFVSGLVETCLNVQDNRITKASIYGDFFSNKEVRDIEQALIGKEYNPEAVFRVLKNFPLQDYFYNVSAEELVTVLV